LHGLLGPLVSLFKRARIQVVAVKFKTPGRDFGCRVEDVTPRISWFDSEALAQQPSSFVDRGNLKGTVESRVGYRGAQVVVIGLQACRRFQQGPFCLGLADMRCKDCCHSTSNLILDREDISHDPIVALGPEMGTGHGVDKLRADADALAANAALQDVPHP